MKHLNKVSAVLLTSIALLGCTDTKQAAKEKEQEAARDAFYKMTPTERSTKTY